MEKPVSREYLYMHILEAYGNGREMTAHECAQMLKKKHITVYGLRQEVQPRIVEMIKKGWMERSGSKYDKTTQKKVSVYKVVQNET